MAEVVLRFDSIQQVFDGVWINAQSDVEHREVEYALARYGLTHLLGNDGDQQEEIEQF